MEIRKEQLTRYISPLREGGSLPALAEASDGYRYAVKLKGAGHGVKSLIAELIGGLVAKAFKFKVPEYVFLYLSPLFGITEPDQEIQDLLRKSEGVNVGLHFLDGAFTFDPAVNRLDSLTASKIVWLDAFLVNVDRSRQNPNMMIWNNELWLIDHGASLYFHHSGKNPEEAALDAFPYIRTHALLPYADRLEEADKLMRQAITPRTLNKIVDLLPDEWLIEEGDDLSPNQKREGYKRFLTKRLANSHVFVEKAIEERNRLNNGK
ncbi:MAG: aminotransferase class I and II [Muribaculaceae bacterium]|nr:aminotransferase class I and II [Muribaculaceae bacterium]